MTACTPEQPCTAANRCDECAHDFAQLNRPAPADDWPYTCRPPEGADEQDVYNRCGVSGLIRHRAAAIYIAAAVAEREDREQRRAS